MQQTIQHFFDPQTSTFSYLVYQGLGSSAIIIDSVLNYDHRSGRTHTHSADQLMIFVKEQQLKVEWILETHAHADHLSAAPYLKQHLGGQIVIGKNISQIQGVFKSIFHLEDDFAVDGSQFDYLIADQEKLAFGNLTYKRWLCQDTPRRVWLMLSEMQFLLGIRCLCPMLVQLGAIFQVEMRINYTGQFKRFWHIH